jgi:hypothetical protein
MTSLRPVDLDLSGGFSLIFCSFGIAFPSGVCGPWYAGISNGVLLFEPLLL